MNAKLLKLKIAEIFQKYPLEIYPDSLGFYRELDDGSFRIGYVYKNKRGVWVNNLNDIRFSQFKSDEIIYSCFTEGYTPFYISNFVHRKCWDETSLTFDDKDDIFYHKQYHGQRAYFEYCRDNAIDGNYMKNLTHLNAADKLFWKNDKRLKSKIAKVVNKNKHLEPTTLRRFEYMLNEPHYENLTPLYTLDGNVDGITYFSYDDQNSIVSLHNDVLPKMFDYEDWAFNTEECLYEQLNEGASIVYMSIDTHENLLYELSETSKSEFNVQAISGIRKYLTYINNDHVFPKLSRENKENYKKLVNVYELSEMKQHQKNIKKKQTMER